MKEFFSNILIAQYFVTRMPVKVFVDDQYLRIVDYDDLSDSNYGFGMTPNGTMEPFDYRMVDHIIVGDNIIDLGTATKKTGDEPEETPVEDDVAATPEEEEPAPEEEPA